MTYDLNAEFPAHSTHPALAYAPDIPSEFDDDGTVFRNAVALRGLAGLALGLFEMLKPHQIVDMDGLAQDSELLVRIAGAHKIATGLGLLLSDDPEPWLIGALAGSTYDAATLAARRANTAAYGRLAAVVATDAALLGMSKFRDIEVIAI